MKTKLSGRTVIVAFILSAAGLSGMAQDGPIATGTVVALSPGQGTVAIRATTSKKPVVFHAVDQASIITSSGRQAALGNVRVGLPVTVYYAPRKNMRIASRIVIPDTIAPQVTTAPALTPAEVKAAQSPAANDGDITTDPGVKARIDDDITTQAGKNALTDPDITKRPK